MGLSTAEQLGRQLAKTSNRVDDVRIDMLPQDVNQNMILGPLDIIKATITVTGTQFNYASDSDRP